MKLSKNQLIMIAIGGVTVVAVLVLGFLAFGAFSANSEADEELQIASDSVRQMYRAKISPDAKSVTAIVSNKTAFAEWRESARAVVSDGDIAPVSGVDEASFKQQMVDDAHEMVKLPGGVEGAIVRSDFTFGFKEFISGGELPAKDKLPQLQRQWADIKLIVGQLSACGVTELVKIEPTVNPDAVAAAQAALAAQNTKKNNRKSAEPEKPAFTRECYALEFRARPLALVKTVNAFATDARFVVVDSMDFARSGDMILAAIAADEKKPAAADDGGSRRRRRPVAAAEEPAAEGVEKVRHGLVNSPELEAPFTVKMTVSTYDFGSKAEVKADAAEIKADTAEAQDETKKEEGNE